jgi:hypothetical protein
MRRTLYIMLNICGAILGVYLTDHGIAAWKNAGYAFEGKFSAYGTGQSAFLGIISGLGLLAFTLWNVLMALRRK